MSPFRKPFLTIFFPALAAYACKSRRSIVREVASLPRVGRGLLHREAPLLDGVVLLPPQHTTSDTYQTKRIFDDLLTVKSRG